MCFLKCLMKTINFFLFPGTWTAFVLDMLGLSIFSTTPQTLWNPFFGSGPMEAKCVTNILTPTLDLSWFPLLRNDHSSDRVRIFTRQSYPRQWQWKLRTGWIMFSEIIHFEMYPYFKNEMGKVPVWTICSSCNVDMKSPNVSITN